MTKKFTKAKYLFLFVGIIALALIIKVHATSPDVILVANSDVTADVEDFGVQGPNRELNVNVFSIVPGKRVSSIDYCLYSEDCDDENNWHDVNEYAQDNVVSSLSNRIGSLLYSYHLNLPTEKINLRINLVDLEPMDISYANYKPATDDEHEFRDVYVDGIYNRDNYDEEFTKIVDGYKGGDIVLPGDCSANGCLLKVTMAKSDYDAINARLDDYNTHYNMDDQDKEFLSIGQMNNHLDDLPTDSILYMEENHEPLIETVNDKVSFYLIINRFFSQKDRADIGVADNSFRILSEDYIGLDYVVDRKYFDEGKDNGFLTFNEYNDYTNYAEIFYGTPYIQLKVDNAIEPVLAPGGVVHHMGTLKNVYNKIESGDNDRFPINNFNELLITSFYEQDYLVPIVLKNGNNVVKNITLDLVRFAFGGNAGFLLLVDDKGINCRQSWMNPDCKEGNIFVSTTYRGLYDTFYSEGVSANIDTFVISNQQGQITGEFLENFTVYERNQDFNPWAVAIFYHDDEVLATKSFDLGELVEVEGYTEEVIPNSEVNNVAKDYNHEFITNYDSNNYEIFGYGLGYAKPMKDIKYFGAREFEDGHIEKTLILASKEEILDNNVNRIALFLTNGELKADENNFPELTYGVGEGKIFWLDGRVFDELGGGE